MPWRSARIHEKRNGNHVIAAYFIMTWPPGCLWCACLPQLQLHTLQALQSLCTAARMIHTLWIHSKLTSVPTVLACCLQEQKSAVGKSKKVLQDKEKELQKALKAAKVKPFKGPSLTALWHV